MASKVLIILPPLIAVLVAFLNNETTEEVIPLDMAYNSVDDQYKGCEREMADVVIKEEHIEMEKSVSPEFNKAWQEGKRKTTKPEDYLTEHHSIAIHVYTNHDYTVFSDFNNATHTEKKNFLEATFKWYSLHFLVTEAVRILKKTQNNCYDTYRGTNVTFDKDVLNKEIRFGSFTSSSLNQRVAQGFGTKSCFVIRTCEGVNITKYSKHPNQKEVLIPPYETFEVTAVKTKNNNNDLWCDTVFVVKNTGKRSYLNCFEDNE